MKAGPDGKPAKALKIAIGNVVALNLGQKAP
jgi:hypothetical protein